MIIVPKVFVTYRYSVFMDTLLPDILTLLNGKGVSLADYATELTDVKGNFYDRARSEVTIIFFIFFLIFGN